MCHEIIKFNTNNLYYKELICTIAFKITMNPKENTKYLYDEFNFNFIHKSLTEHRSGDSQRNVI